MATHIGFHKHGDSDILKAVEFTPVDLTENETQVENKAIGINYTDTYIRSGPYPPPSLPSDLGTEAAGMVGRVGNKVTHIKAGDRVVYTQSILGTYSSVYNVPADEAAILPNAILLEQAATSFLKGLAVFYLLHKTYGIQPDEPFSFHAAADGVGMIARQWAKTLGAKLIGTVGSAQEAQTTLQAGTWQVISYREESVVERMKEIAGGRKVRAVYDSVGKDTWEASLGCLRCWGLMVSFGNASGSVTGVNLGILSQKGSLCVARPSLQGYVTSHRGLAEASNELFSLIASGVIKVDVAPGQTFALHDAQRAHEVLESRATQGSSLLIP